MFNGEIKNNPFLPVRLSAVFMRRQLPVEVKVWQKITAATPEKGGFNSS